MIAEGSLLPSSREPGSLESTARAVQRLAVLLSAGVPPGAAWGYLGDGNPVVARVATDGIAVLDCEDVPWRSTAAAWTVATEAGAPLAPTLREFARSLRSLAAVERDIETAMAGPRATTKLVMVLPVVALLFGMVLGFNPIGVLVSTAPGLVCLAAGLALMGAAWGWNRRLLRAARPGAPTGGLRCELVAVAVSGGGALEKSIAFVDATMTRLDLEDTDVAVDEVIALSVRAGVPAAELLRSEAEESRRAAAAEAQRKAEVLAVRLMLPLGVCILPAFMLLGVAPLVISVITSTVGGM
jgi:tight adherence protein B